MEQAMIILAGNYREFQNYIESHKVPLRGYRTIYGETAEKMAGIRVNEFITIGTFWDKKDAKSLYDFAHTRVV